MNTNSNDIDDRMMDNAIDQWNLESIIREHESSLNRGGSQNQSENIERMNESVRLAVKSI